MSFDAPKKALKLSKNLLEMKFMKRTKEKAIQEKAAEEGRVMFEKDITDGMKSGGEKFIVEPSYVPCENLVIGRLSFGGMSPHIEKLMEIEEEVINPKPNPRDIGKDISDEEMAKYSTLMRTVALKFKSKNRRLRNKTSQVTKPKFLKPKEDD